MPLLAELERGGDGCGYKHGGPDGPKERTQRSDGYGLKFTCWVQHSCRS